MDNKQPEKITLSSFIHLYSWSAPDRYWKPRDRNWYLWYALLFVVLIFLSALTEQYFLILALIALLLLLFAQAAVPPIILKHEITNRGIKVFDTFYKWRDIDHFWITEKTEGTLFGLFNKQGPRYRLVNFDIPGKNPPRVSLMIGDGDEETIISTLLEYTPYADAEETSDDLISRLIYGRHIAFKHYAPESEYYPETAEFPEQVITETPQETEQEREELRKHQMSELKGTHKKDKDEKSD